MNKKLILAEKPSVGRDIARVLKCTTKGEGSIEGNEFIVTWAMGHLVELAAPEKYNERYKSWNLEDLPIMPDKMQLEVISKTSKQFHSVKKLMLRKDVSEIIIATDAGREGELVARWIINKVKVNKPVKRLWISSVTDKAISDGFKSLKDGRLYENLYHSALARAESDWLVGINATRALTTKYNAQLSCGRVQTPTLNLVASRQAEIRGFVPKDFSEIKLSAGGVSFTWQNEKTRESRIFDQGKCDALMNKLKNSQEGRILKAEFKEKSVFPPLLYDLTELQRDANRLFDLSAKETLSITQRLYENHKVLTYPRTDSRYIPTDIVPTLKDRLNAINTGEYSSYVRELLGKPITAQKHFVDDAKISDHHALIPTEEKVRLGNLSEMEEKIFNLVAKRFLAVLYPPYKYKQLSLTFEVDGEIFAATGKVTLSPGWKKVYQGENILEEDHEAALPDLKAGETMQIKDLKGVKGQTKPPQLFTEGTLLSAMENPGKYMLDKDKNLAKILDSTGGLGTVATRADIIEKLFSKFYIEKKDKYLSITSKGTQLLELVPEELKSPDLTAQWEQKLERIKNGSLVRNDFISEIKTYTVKVINEIKGNEAHFVHTNKTGDKCPKCGKYMLLEKDKNGTILVCSDRECRERVRIAKTTNARCPNCHKRMTLTGTGDGQTFSCKCGYREKLSAFNKRKSEENKGISKRDAQKYLQKQDTEDLNTAMMDALAKFKF